MAAAVLPAFSTNLGTAATATLLGGWEGAVRVGLGGRGWGLAFYSTPFGAGKRAAPSHRHFITPALTGARSPGRRGRT